MSGIPNLRPSIDSCASTAQRLLLGASAKSSSAGSKFKSVFRRLRSGMEPAGPAFAGRKQKKEKAPSPRRAKRNHTGSADLDCLLISVGCSRVDQGSCDGGVEDLGGVYGS
ncbi:unnamed protein product [Tuber aestivum]|uniref:Uncharacterized protein n=1 Tax=Tuber aestivum TaxID=59557 RepID=A0A292Q1D3_9PEZI|nr:unnamed protein product [Tuber aestivum]